MIKKILNEISRLKKELKGYSASEALDYIEAYINAISKEPASEGLEEAAKEYSFNIPTQLEADIVWKKETEQHFKDGAKWQLNQMKEALQTEYEKGRFDMQQEMMKDAVETTIVDDWQYGKDQDHAVIPAIYQRIEGFNVGDKAKIIIIKSEQQ